MRKGMTLQPATNINLITQQAVIPTDPERGRGPQRQVLVAGVEE
jgi:hypothetical protein